MIRRSAAFVLGCALILSSCGGNDDGTLDLAFIADPDSLYTSDLELTEPAQHIRAATASGLVARDADGELVPALADRWIVTDDGLSFIFRLRSGTWPDGTPLTARSVRAALLQAIRGLDGTAIELDLAPVEEVRAMAGRVVELRLSGPFPNLLQLLAAPELALAPDQGSGEMVMARQNETALLLLKPPGDRGLPDDEDWEEDTRMVRVTGLSPIRALEAFDNGEAEAVLGGQIDSLPLVDIGPLARGTVRLDPTIGLFGLRVMRPTGPLASQASREAIAMAIDRPALIEPFGVGGWTPTTRIVNPGLADDPSLVAERWSGRSIEELRAEAARRIAVWREGQPNLAPGPIVLKLAIAAGPGNNLLLRELNAQLSALGIRFERVGARERADLVLVDQIARYAARRWFLNQFNCALKRGLCSEDADLLVAQAITERNLAERETLLAQAEAELAAADIYIPFGVPLRWSLIRSDVRGFAPNQWAFHPLPPMAMIAR